MLLYGSLVGHFLGCACRPGPIHTPTDYRIADWLILSQAQSYTLPTKRTNSASRVVMEWLVGLIGGSG